MSLGYWETLITAQVDGTAVTAAAATTLLPPAAKFTLPANFFRTIGQQLNVRASGRISSLITTPGTAQFVVRFGANLVFDSGAVLLDTAAGHTNMPWTLDIVMTCRSLGATATLFGQGEWKSENILGTPSSSPKGSIVAMLPWNAAPAVGASFDSAASQVVDLYFTQTVASGSCQLHQYALISPN